MPNAHTSSNGNGYRIIFWILGALMTVVGVLSGIAHNVIMGQLDSIERRIERIEDKHINEGRGR